MSPRGTHGFERKLMLYGSERRVGQGLSARYGLGKGSTRNPWVAWAGRGIDAQIHLQCSSIPSTPKFAPQFGVWETAQQHAEIVHKHRSENPRKGSAAREWQGCASQRHAYMFHPFLV